MCVASFSNLIGIVTAFYKIDLRRKLKKMCIVHCPDFDTGDTTVTEISHSDLGMDAQDLNSGVTRMTRYEISTIFADKHSDC